MTDMWTDLLPVLFAMMISPARTLAVILLLHTPRSRTTALAYVAGMSSSMMLQGVSLGAAMSLVGLASDDRSADLWVLGGALFLVGGVILLAGGFKIATTPSSGGGSLASLLQKLERIEPAGAYKIGFGWLLASPKQWVFVMTAVAVIIGAFAVAEDRVGPVLDAVFAWIKGHLRPTAVGVFTLFGLIFLIKGLSTLA